MAKLGRHRKALEESLPPSEGAPPPVVEDWRTRLEVKTKNGAFAGYLACLANVITILEQHDAWRGRLRFDLFSEQILLDGKPWCDADTARLREWMQRRENGFQIDAGKYDAIDAAIVVAQQRSFHPVREWLSSIDWDGTSRIDSLLTTYFRAENSTYTRGVGARWMISAVARVMRPGCKVDCMPVLEGETGTKKSSGVAALVGDEWFLDSFVDLQNLKAAYETIQGKWIIELAELDALGRADVSRVKAFLTSQADHFRASYGHFATTHQRQCVFIGTTNEDRYLKDTTGNRRFWPVRCGLVNLEAIRRDRAQLWAEARVRFERGEAWHADTLEFTRAAIEEQEERMQIDPWEHIVAKWLLHGRDGVTTTEVITDAIGKAKGQITRLDEMRAAVVLKRVGFGDVRRHLEVGGRFRRYYRTTSPRRINDLREVGQEVGPNIPEENQVIAQPGQPGQPHYTYAGSPAPKNLMEMVGQDGQVGQEDRKSHKNIDDCGAQPIPTEVGHVQENFADWFESQS